MTTNVSSLSASSNVTPLNINDTQGGDALGQINDLMVRLGSLLGKLRDLLREYNQLQQTQTFKMQQTAFQTKLEGIEKSFQAEQNAAIGQIFGGVIEGFAGVAGVKNPALSSIGSGISNTMQSSFKLDASGLTRDGAVKQAEAEYQHGLADTMLKRSDEVLEKALKVSGDMRELLTMLTQAHDRIASMR
ncbi:hypothetical protein ACUHMQ_14800 [Chitinimonas sp. PSY-7]|uniref:hypothetical protein n=1 Tax=Chitinimonas sp. PSY-7 TaxID=3459088 RepID=UPI00404036BE